MPIHVLKGVAIGIGGKIRGRRIEKLPMPGVGVGIDIGVLCTTCLIA